MGKIKKKLSIAKILILILLIIIIVCGCIYLYKKPVKYYEIKGNKILKDIDIIRDLGLDDYPSFVSINTNSLTKKLESNSLITHAKVRYGWNYKLIIEIEENTPVFYIKGENKIKLANGEKIDNNENIMGLPVLLNSTPESIQNTLASNLAKVDSGIIASISEIEYKPSYSKDEKVIDENRFLLSMNDNNLIYITSKKADMLNDYLDIIATKKIVGNGILYLDSDEGGNLFTLFN